MLYLDRTRFLQKLVWYKVFSVTLLATTIAILKSGLDKSHESITINIFEPF